MTWMVARALLARLGSDPKHEGIVIYRGCCNRSGLHASKLYEALIYMLKRATRFSLPIGSVECIITLRFLHTVGFSDLTDKLQPSKLSSMTTNLLQEMLLQRESATVYYLYRLCFSR